MQAPLEFVISLLDEKKRAAPNGSPFWMARDVMSVLGYSDWTNFQKVLEKSIVSCDTSGEVSANHFCEVTEMVNIGSGAQRRIDNWILSKYACYLVAMNGDPSKPEIATAQSYFATQTHKQEAQEQLMDHERRLLLRDRVKDANKKLSGAAQNAGVRNVMFGVFHDEGYKGLYGGLGVREVKKSKGIPDDEEFLDCIGRAELAANEFRITQTEEQLRIKKVHGEQKAIETHRTVGAKVRSTIKEIGGTMPEKLPSEPSIKKLAAQKARAKKKALQSGTRDES